MVLHYNWLTIPASQLARQPKPPFPSRLLPHVALTLTKPNPAHQSVICLTSALELWNTSDLDDKSMRRDVPLLCLFRCGCDAG